MKVKCPYIAYRKCILCHYDITFGPIFLKTSIYLLLMTDYHPTKFGLIWSKESKVTEGARPPQVENVLNRPGEIGLNYWLAKMQYSNLKFLLCSSTHFWLYIKIMWSYLSIIDLSGSVFAQSIFYNVICSVGSTSEILRI